MKPDEIEVEGSVIFGSCPPPPPNTLPLPRPRAVRPLRNLVCVERLPGLGCTLNADGDTVTAGGIILPRAFKRKHPSQKIGAVPDFFRARVVGVGPDVPVGELSPGEEVLVFSFQASEKEGLYTGVDAGAGRLFVDYPDDIVCALEAS